MGILAWIVVGIIAGWLAGLVVKGRGMGLLGNMVVGIIGALLGAWVANLLKLNASLTGFNLPTLLVAFGGSVLLLFILKILRR
jgi:Predicted membrane protein